MNEKIWVRWELKRSENRYFVLDWMYEDRDSLIPDGWEEVEVDSNIIETLILVNEENIEYFGFYETEEKFNDDIQKLIEEDEMSEPESIEWAGPDHYVKWGLDSITICNALEALDTEYDAAFETNWLSWLTGWTRDSIYNAKDAKDCLMDIYGCEIDKPCESTIEDYISQYINKKDEVIDENNNINAEVQEKINKLLDEAENVGRIDPAYLP